MPNIATYLSGNVTNNLDDEYKFYLGLAETIFKERYSNQKSSFNNKNSKNSTELSKYVWSLYHQLNGK